MKRFPLHILSIAASLVATALLLASCGESESTTVVNRLVSPAQEEADLKRALDAGAITPDEYQEQLQKLRSGN